MDNLDWFTGVTERFTEERTRNRLCSAEREYQQQTTNRSSDLFLIIILTAPILNNLII